MTRAALANRVAVAMISIAVVVLGLVSLRRIPVDLFPEITFPVVMVRVAYPGAGPRDVEASVTQNLERAIASVPNVLFIESTSRQGMSEVRANFAWDADVDIGAFDAVQRVQRAMGSLPEGVRQPSVTKMDQSDFAVVGLTVSGGGLDERALYDLAYNRIQPQIERVPGVATAVISGGRVRQIEVNVDRDSLQARDLTATDVVDALGRSNFLMPSGSLRVGPVEYNVFTETQIPVVDRLGDVVIRNSGPGRAPVFVRDVADVVDGAEELTNVVRVDGKPGVNLWVRKQPGANTVEVVDSVLAALPSLRGIPEGVEVRSVFDQAQYIRKSIDSLVNESLVGAFLAVFVMFLFLRSFRSTAVVGLSIPLSMFATFILLYFAGKQSLNTFTLGGLALGVGRLVDDSIVVLENIFRHRTLGKSPRDAALDGAREVAMPVLASTIATIAVFVPVVFLTGVSKLLFVPMTLTIVFALASSYVVSMAVIPALTLRFVKPLDAIPEGSRRFRDRFQARWGAALVAIEDFYEAVLRAALGRRAPIVAVFLSLFAGAMALFPFLGTEFFPRTDESQFNITIRSPIGTRVELTDVQAAVVEQAVIESLGAEHLNAVTSDSGVRQSGGMGGMGNSGGHQARVRVRLVPPSRRPFDDEQAMAMVRKALADRLPGTLVYFDAGGIVRRVTNFGSEAPLDIEITGYDLEDARVLTDRVRELVESTPGTTDVRASREDEYPELDVMVDREKAALLGTSARAVADAVLTSVAGNVNSPGIYTDPVSGKEYGIVVRFRETDRDSLSDLEDVPVPLGSGRPVALRTLADVSPGVGPVKIDRKFQERIVHVTANVSGRPLGDVAAEVEQGLDAIDLPEGFEVRLGGERAQQKDSFEGLFLALALALMLVYMTMASQFHSLREPFVVMFSVPMGLIGVVAALWLTGTPLSVNAFMGIIMMVGIVVSNGILLVEFANHALADGATPVEAVILAGRTRLRPILMTTLTTLLGLTPMAIGIGEGSESNVPLARAVVGGLTVSTLFTLVLVPILYSWLRRQERPQD